MLKNSLTNRNSSEPNHLFYYWFLLFDLIIGIIIILSRMYSCLVLPGLQDLPVTPILNNWCPT